MSVCSKFCCTNIQNLSVSLNGETILHGVNLHLHCGELTAIIGPNGAGKSTLLKAIVGQIPYSGSLEFMGESGCAHVPKVGYVPQKIKGKNLPISVLDFLCAGATSAPICFKTPDNVRINALDSLSRAGAAHLARKRIFDLSGGELQRVMLAFALSPIPNLLLLDEPSSGMDKNGISQFWDVINEVRLACDIAIIIVSHDFAQVKKYADTVVLMDKTILMSGTPSDVFASAEFGGVFY